MQFISSCCACISSGLQQRGCWSSCSAQNDNWNSLSLSFLKQGHRIQARNLPLDMKSSLRRLAVSSAASFLSPGSFFPVNSRRPISLVLFLSRIDRPCSFSASSNASGFTACFFTSETKNDIGLDGHEFQTWHNGGGNFHKSAFIDSTVQIEMGATVHSKSVLGANVHVGSGTVIGPGVIIGKSTKIGYNVALSNCSIGDSCIIHSGVCIGQDGFGFFVDENGAMVKKPQVLNARIGNYVEIGANTCIDRGSWRDTVIGDHSKIDNLVQIGHNVVIGENCMLCGQVGIAGSVTIGDYVTFGGRVAVRDHVSIATKVRLAANSCVTKDIKESGDYGGFPAIPVREWRRQMANHSQFYKSRSRK